MERLSLANGKAFKDLLKTAEKAFKQLHKNEGYKPEDLKTEKVYQDLLEQTYGIFDTAIQDNVVPEVMKAALQSDAFMVAGLKTHAQLFEASTVLMKPDGSVRSYASLENELNKLNVRYNATYLESEYQFAVGSSQMASKWNDFDDDDNYNLQYRTAGDKRVRDSHDKLRDTTLPKNDPFWDSFLPPNGWRCRCTVVEVAADKYTPSISKDAIEKGMAATNEIGKNGKNRLEIFRFNAGKEQKLFPPKLPYNASRCTENGKLSITGLIGMPTFVLSAEKSKCEASKIVEEMRKEKLKEERKAKDKEIKEWAKENIPESGKTINLKNFKTKEIQISRSSIKSIGDHFSSPALKDVALNIISNLKNCKYITSAPLDKESKNYEKKLLQGVTNFHYYEFEWNNQLFRLNTEEIKGRFEKPYAANLIIKK
jgi:SPP1 gp7 family putative phage head morphogenesis protein